MGKLQSANGKGLRFTVLVHASTLDFPHAPHEDQGTSYQRVLVELLHYPLSSEEQQLFCFDKVIDTLRLVLVAPQKEAKA